MKPNLALAAALCFVLMQAEADAHAFLVKAEPAVGSQAALPQTLRLEFNEAVELGFSGIDVTNASGGAVPLNDLRFADASRKVLIAGFPMLMPGAYRVRWHVVSVDTHRTEGEFRFTVKS